MPERQYDDPRAAPTLQAAALNPDGKTWSGARALSWLSKVLDPAGKGLPVEEVEKEFAKAKAEADRRKAKKAEEGDNE